MEDLRGEILELGDRLHARVAAPGDHVGEVLRTNVGLIGGLRDLEAPQQRVAQVEGLEDALEADGVVGEPRYWKIPRDRPERDDQVVVRKLERVSLDRDAPDLRRSGSQCATRPIRSCAFLSSSRIGTVTCRGFSAPPATAGSSGE